MIYPIAAIAILFVLMSRAGVLPKWRGRILPGVAEKGGAIAAAIAALVVLVHGNVWAALCLFGVGLWLLGRSSRLMSMTRGARTRISRVRSAMVEMDYDQGNGSMRGRIIAGAYEGAGLERLDRGQCEAVYAECLRHDVDGARLLEAYFDRRFVGWRPAGQSYGDARESGRARSSVRMSEDEAYEVLGLRRGASRDEVVRTHRTVMKKWHPDQGGTAELAALANEAKEVLMRRHA